MEELINKLIEKGWKPRGIYTSLIVGYGLVRCEEFVGSPNNERKSYRELVSKESGLWQFVCENELYNPNNRGYWGKNVTIVGEYPTLDGDENIGCKDYEYYLIESALKDESELEQFLLDNIKL